MKGEGLKQLSDFHKKNDIFVRFTGASEREQTDRQTGGGGGGLLLLICGFMMPPKAEGMIESKVQT